ncbi:MAG: FAD-binding oxidoreductase [Hyphomicrobiaceae bacterium]|nr:FAD-binding oxidoreductase [Hyphomicrobiaceae bacterium]
MTGDNKNNPDAIVVGAGVIGMSVAVALQNRGLNVLVLDRKGVAAETSRGNAGALTFSSVDPHNSPSVIRKVPKWFFDPMGPFSIPARYAIQATPWLLRFVSASRPSRVARTREALAALMEYCRDDLQDFSKMAGTHNLLHNDGGLEIYDTEGEFNAAIRSWERRQDLGMTFEPVRGAKAISDYQPGLDPKFQYAIHTKIWQGVSDPLDYVEALGETFRARGGDIEICGVDALENRPEGCQVKLGDGRTLSTKNAIICAGAWSHTLAQKLGDKIPLEAERGYNTTLPPAALDLKRAVTFASHAFFMTRLTSGIRIGGAVELGGLTLPPNFTRADALLAKAKSFFPDLKTEDGKQWMGHRPCLPDNLPVIGKSPNAQNIIYAFGHGHYGLTQSAGTGKLVAALVFDETPPIDMAPYRPDRF